MTHINDLYGHITLEEGVRWGANTQRSLEHFKIGIEKMPWDFIVAMLQVKKAAAIVNERYGTLSAEKASAIQEACDFLLKEESSDRHFPLSIWQTGSGTQTNMNVNEVIAFTANQNHPHLKIHPNDDVNASQSTNDVFPTALHVMSVQMIRHQLFPEMEAMIETLDHLSSQHASLIKIGRTHLQDATPLTFGQEVGAWAQMLKENRNQLELSLQSLYKLPIGATAVGTGLNSVDGYAKAICETLSLNLSQPFVSSDNLFHAISSKDALVFNHGALSSLAANAYKIANDIRWLASGPRCGLGEISIPANEAGSSIMPGKVNPTQSEALMMVSIQVMGNQTAMTMASSQGNFQLNTFMPLMLQNQWQSLRLLTDALKSFNTHCLIGLTPNIEVMSHNLHHSLMTATALNKHLGYDQTARLVKEAHENQSSIKEVVLKHGLMTEEAFDSAFDFAAMTHPSKPSK